MMHVDAMRLRLRKHARTRSGSCRSAASAAPPARTGAGSARWLAGVWGVDFAPRAQERQRDGNRDGDIGMDVSFLLLSLMLNQNE